MPTISLCLIVKNEEHCLERCLQSVQGLVDEIIIVDTGSTDATKQIAQQYTNNIIDFSWVDDFSAARNESLRHATKDWILVLDADEMLSSSDHLRIRALLEVPPETDAFCFIQRNYFQSEEDLRFGLQYPGFQVRATSMHPLGFIPSQSDRYAESKGMVGWLPTPLVRLFRNKKGFCFTGVVHEDVRPSIFGRIQEIDVPIHHFGKVDAQRWKEKWVLYQRLGERKVNMEQDYFAHYELGRQHLENQKTGEARVLFEKALELKNNFWPAWLTLGTMDLLEGDVSSAIGRLETAARLNTLSADIYSNLGVAYAKAGDFKKALAACTAGLNVNFRRPDIYRNMARCYEELGDSYRAGLALKKAKEYGV